MSMYDCVYVHLLLASSLLFYNFRNDSLEKHICIQVFSQFEKVLYEVTIRFYI